MWQDEDGKDTKEKKEMDELLRRLIDESKRFPKCKLQ